MKPTFLILFLSIFFGSHICKAQSTENYYKICNYVVKNDAVSAAQVLKFAGDDCGQIIFTDKEGFEYKITGYTFAMSPKNGGNAYFEQVNGDELTATIKERLAKAANGDLIVLAQVKCIKQNGTEGLLNGFNFHVTP